MSLLLVLWGESYRSGKQMSRTRGTNNYVERQLLASSSHINLINNLKTQHETDVFINTYKLNIRDDSNLLNYYKNNNVNISKYIFHNAIFSNEESFLNDMYDNTNKLLETKKYEYVIFLRIDLYIKFLFIKNISLEPDKIQFPHIDSNSDLNHFNQCGRINVCHFIMICPKKFYNIIEEKIIYNSTHGIMNKILDSGININSIKFMLNTLHICSTDLGWNPLYIQVGRSYKLLYNIFSGGEKYIYDDNHKLVLDCEKGIKLCNEYMNKETEEYNFLLPILY